MTKKKSSHAQQALENLNRGDKLQTFVSEQPNGRDSLRILGSYASAFTHALLAVAESQEQANNLLNKIDDNIEVIVENTTHMAL